VGREETAADEAICGVLAVPGKWVDLAIEKCELAIEKWGI
jgi:hypothetical protein